MPRAHCICALLLTLAAPAAAQDQAGSTQQGFTVFVQGSAIGREQVTVTTGPTGTTISGEGRLNAPVDLTLRRAEIRYAPGGAAESVTVDATIAGAPVSLRTQVDGTTAVSSGSEAGPSGEKRDQLSNDSVIIHNLFFGSNQAIATRLRDAEVGTTIPVYIAPLGEVPVRVTDIQTDRMQTGTTTFGVRRYALVFGNPGGDLAVNLTADDSGALIALNVPAQSLDVVRDDVASATSRMSVYSNPGDRAVLIPGAGFNIGATLTDPERAQGPVPAVILLSGSDAADRDGVLAGVPIMGQLAGAVAEAGFLAVRYDRRGSGQTGGRAESASLSDHVDDVRAVVRWLRDQDEVDDRRIAVIGHGDGAWVALLAATRENRVAAVGLLAAAADTGAELVLTRQQEEFERADVPAEERAARADLQRRIHEAVLTGRGWEQIPPAVRAQADTPWFDSFLRFDPARVIDDVDQPLLLLHGELDRQVPVAQLDRLATLAREESDSEAVEVITVRGVNHLLVPAVTGEVREYGTLSDRNVSRDVLSAITDWLSRSLPPRR
ncbi:MAG: alpha/beta hydrolase family protein [Vicinamibacterales bacterium]